MLPGVIPSNMLSSPWCYPASYLHNYNLLHDVARCHTFIITICSMSLPGVIPSYMISAPWHYQASYFHMYNLPHYLTPHHTYNLPHDVTWCHTFIHTICPMTLHGVIPSSELSAPWRYMVSYLYPCYLPYDVTWCHTFIRAICPMTLPTAPDAAVMMTVSPSRSSAISRRAR